MFTGIYNSFIKRRKLVSKSFMKNQLINKVTKKPPILLCLLCFRHCPLSLQLNFSILILQVRKLRPKTFNLFYAQYVTEPWLYTNLCCLVVLVLKSYKISCLKSKQPSISGISTQVYCILNLKFKLTPQKNSRIINICFLPLHRVAFLSLWVKKDKPLEERFGRLISLLYKRLTSLNFRISLLVTTPSIS